MFGPWTPEDIADMNLDAGSRIRLMPGLVGGRAC